jgi:uncharacterized membrane protein YeaQ/YmgE (transglycosylase-associated protein family)
MSLIEFAVLAGIAIVTGSLAQSFVGISKSGCFISILVGFIGAFVGFWVTSVLVLPKIYVINLEGIEFPLFWSAAAAILFTGFIAVVSPRKV